MKQPHRYEGVDTTTTELSKTDEETTKHTTVKGIPTPHELHAHYLSTLALCSAVFSMFYLIFSIFPYGGFMALHLVPGLQPNSVGIYAGILTGSMKIASVVTAYPWGIVSDTYGRKFVLVFSTASSGVFMFAFGFATNFTVAVAIRVLIGLSTYIEPHTNEKLHKSKRPVVDDDIRRMIVESTVPTNNLSLTHTYPDPILFLQNSKYTANATMTIARVSAVSTIIPINYAKEYTVVIIHAVFLWL